MPTIFIIAAVLDLPVREGLCSKDRLLKIRKCTCNVVIFKIFCRAGVASAIPLEPRRFAADRPALPIPELLAPDARSRIQLVVQAGKTTFGQHAATTWGYNGNLLGPALQLRKGKAVTVDIHNTLAEETTLHWHGLEVPGEVDGASGRHQARW